MTDFLPSSYSATAGTLKQRSYPKGSVIGVNAYGLALDAVRSELAAASYVVEATPHFLVCRGTAEGMPALLVHWFAPADIDNNLSHYLAEELKPLGIVRDGQEFGDAFGAVVNCVNPGDPGQAWLLFTENTLRKVSDLMATGPVISGWGYPIEVSAALYRRTQDLCAGASFLDAGCSAGLLPLLMAERLPALTDVVGIDISDEPFACPRSIARQRHLDQVRFEKADLLSDDLASFPSFDTVAALHVLEHLSEPEMFVALANLLKLSARRLIIAVPYEGDEPKQEYGHQQAFERERLEAVGRWCTRQWGGGTVRYEQCAGGLLCVERD